MRPRARSFTNVSGATLLALGCACLARSAQATDACPFNLPTQSVCFTLYGPFPPPPAPPTYLQIVLAGIGLGFDVQDGVGYAGWCADDQISATPGQQYCDLPTLLRNSTGALPPYLQTIPWDKINYILNHKGTHTASEIQGAIWQFTNGTACPSQGCSDLVDDANANGSGFVPAPGQIVAVILDNGTNPIAQPSFFEMPCGGVGCTRTKDYWEKHACEWPAPFAPGIPNRTDANHNGIADDLEGQCGVTGNPSSQCPCDSNHAVPIGSVLYTQCKLLCVLTLSENGNAVRILAGQLIATKLNRFNGASVAATVSDPNDPANPYNGLTVNQLVAEADVLIGFRNLMTAYQGTDCGGHHADPTGCSMVQVAALLGIYNSGRGGVPRCD